MKILMEKNRIIEWVRISPMEFQQNQSGVCGSHARSGNNIFCGNLAVLIFLFNLSVADGTDDSQFKWFVFSIEFSTDWKSEIYGWNRSGAGLIQIA